MECVLLKEMSSREGTKPVGTRIDHEQAHLLVKMGVAIPSDDECEDVCRAWWDRQGLTIEEGLAKATETHREVEAGIHPDDREKFKSGEIEGYNADGSYKPGPNAKPENHGGVIVVDDE